MSFTEQKIEYMMLARLQADCDYFLDFGGRSTNVIWGNSVQEHIFEMKRLWNCLTIKPIWLTWEEIISYENLMLN